MDKSSKKSKTLDDHWGKANPIWESNNVSLSSGNTAGEEPSSKRHCNEQAKMSSNDDEGGCDTTPNATANSKRANIVSHSSGSADKKCTSNAAANSKKANDVVSHSSSGCADTKCPSLRLSIDRWGLKEPYHSPTSEKHWGAYFAERATLEFRHDTFFPEDDKNKGQELKHYAQCYRFSRSKCQDATVAPETEDSPPSCSNCNKQYSKGGYVVQYDNDIKLNWAALVRENATLESVYCSEDVPSYLAKRPPFMRPHCTESYATDCHSSGTPKGEYEDLRERIQMRIVETIHTTNILDDENQRKLLGESIASGLFILDYFANFEECDVDAEVRTVEFATRLYPPNGSGESIDLSWYRHFRERNTISNEKYSTLHVHCRKLEDCDPTRPTYSRLSRANSSAHDALAVLDGDTDEDNVRKTFPLLDELRDLRLVVFGPSEEKNVSPRKVFGLIARASGAHAVRQEGGWLYAGMRKRYELYPGEESDGEEDGPEDGPGGCFIIF